jgi:uncharacterized protein
LIFDRTSLILYLKSYVAFQAIQMKNIFFKDQVLLKSRHRDRSYIMDVRYQETETPKPVVIFVHGFKGYKDWGHFNLMADYFARHGFVFVKFNLSHNGTTPEKPREFADLEAFGNNNFTIELDDLQGVIDYLFSEQCLIPENEMDLEKLFLIGHSRGGALAIMKTAEEKRIKGLVTWAAVSDLERHWDKHVLDSWKEKGVQMIYNSRTHQHMPLYYQLAEDVLNNHKRINIKHAMHRIEQPMLIIHGTYDPTVKFRAAYELKSWKPEARILIIDEADHTFGGKEPFEDKLLPEDAQLVANKSVEFLKGV